MQAVRVMQKPRKTVQAVRVMQKNVQNRASCSCHAKKRASCSACKNHAKTMQNAARTECQPAEHPLSPGSLLYVLYVLYLTRQATEHSLSPGSLHDTNSLHVFLHDTNSLHGFARFSHDMWLNPVPLPCFFPVRPYVGSSWSWRTPRQGGAERAPITVPSGHSAERALVTKCAEQAQCRAGTSN